MKILLMGGTGQGKRTYAMSALALGAEQIADGGAGSPGEVLTAPALSGLHLLVRRLLEQGEDPREQILSALDSREDWIVLCDETGSGIVPLDRSDRHWREETGRICCMLAERADRVERITCGISQKLKG